MAKKFLRQLSPAQAMETRKVDLDYTSGPAPVDAIEFRHRE
jgi:hypothetical protein